MIGVLVAWLLVVAGNFEPVHGMMAPVPPPPPPPPPPDQGRVAKGKGAAHHLNPLMRTMRWTFIFVRHAIISPTSGRGDAQTDVVCESYFVLYVCMCANDCFPQRCNATSFCDSDLAYTITLHM